jgi:hypothetical protein
MSAGATIFMLGTWAVIVVVNIYCFVKILKNQTPKE